mgnify:CR=1 FL=1
MNQGNQKSKIISYLLVLFLSVSIFSTINVNANFVTLADDGIIYDEFDNPSDIDVMVNSSCQSGWVNLTKGNPTYEYNYAKRPGNIEVWDHERVFLPDNFLGQIISQYVSPALLLGNSIKSSSHLVKIGSINDGKELNTTGRKLSKTNPKPANPIQHYQFKIEQDKELIDHVSLKWWHGPYEPDSNLDNINLYIWSYGSIIPRWENVNEVIYNNSNIDKTDDSADLQYTFSDKGYVNDDGYIDVLIVGTPDHDGDQSILFTDFINMSVSTIKGYFSEGHIISKLIEPTDFGGWEKVFWESSEYSEQSGVTIQVLDENKNLIESFSSTETPFDISNVDESKIRLKAILHSSSPYVTPLLYSWGVMWQKENSYLDNFDSTYRIEETQGTIIESGEINVSSYYSDWEFFGKKADNTRYYDGKTIDSEPGSYSWYTEYGFGGGFKSPVVSEGKVYIASSKDNKIYAFNETPDSNLMTQKPVDESNALPFEVDSCIAVTDDYIIVGTAGYNQKNKIYALDKYDLSNQEWVYPASNDAICFSAPPTIHEGKLFVTSWSGRLWDLPFVSFLNQYIGGNNKLICLNINTGTKMWDATLPAGSLSAPAIGGEFVYAGCQNMYGSSILAFDYSSGEKIWNTTAGIIGRSSPVFAKDKLFVLSNEKTNISKNGEYKINCLNALNGKKLWNKSFGQMEMTNYIRGLKSTTFFYKLIEGFAPITTPAYYDDTLYVVTPNGTLLALLSNGTEKWSYDMSGDYIDLSFYTASPLIVGEKLYVVTGNANIYCFDVSTNTLVWNHQMTEPDEYILQFLPPDVMASPVLADGMLFVSSTENPTNLSGRIYCLGSYSPNSKGYVKSTTIHVPNGKWWDEFKAVRTNTTENTITFSILDKDNTILKTLTNYNGSYVDISNIKCSGIKLYANFNVLNGSDTYPVLDSWEVTWTDETGTPVFLDETFEPGEDGWVNLDLEECSIEVKDTEHNDILSGIDVDTAEFRLGYVPKNSETPKYSSWYTATSEDSSGVEQTKIVADIQSLSLQMSELINITFRIRDLAGNLATSNTTTFRIDSTKPSSEITSSLDEEYNDVFVIQAEAEDQAGFLGDTNISGISTVSLKYQYKNESSGEWSEWETFTEKALPFSCYFGEDEQTNEELKSGQYRLVTIAKDKAGNYEDLDNDKVTDSFLLDLISPELLNNFEDISEQRTIPTFSLSVQDDYKLDSLYYKLDNQDDWNEIETTIGKENATIEWTMDEDAWVEFVEGIQRTVYFKVTDSLGNSYETTENDALKITKDEDMNDLYVDVSDFSDWHWDETFEVTAQIPSEINVDSIQLFYKYSEDNKTWTEWERVGFIKSDVPYSWDFTAMNRSGNYQFYIKVTDTSGAVYTSSVENVKLTLLPVHHTVLVIALAVILLITSLFIIKKVRTKKQ